MALVRTALAKVVRRPTRRQSRIDCAAAARVVLANGTSTATSFSLARQSFECAKHRDSVSPQPPACSHAGASISTPGHGPSFRIGHMNENAPEGVQYYSALGFSAKKQNRRNRAGNLAGPGSHAARAGRTKSRRNACRLHVGMQREIQLPASYGRPAFLAGFRYVRLTDEPGNSTQTSSAPGSEDYRVHRKTIYSAHSSAADIARLPTVHSGNFTGKAGVFGNERMQSSSDADGGSTSYAIHGCSGPRIVGDL